jgi:TolA-binding protein
MNRALSLVFLVAIAGAAPGCAWITENSKIRDEQERQIMVAVEREALLESQLEAAQTRIDSLEETVRLHGQNESDRLETIEEVNTEIARVRGLLEELQFQVKAQQKYLDESSLDRERRMVHAERRLTQLEKYLHVTPPPPPTNAELGVVVPDVTNADGSVTHSDGSVTRLDGTTLHPDGSVTAFDGTMITPPTNPVETPPATDTTAPPATADEAIDLAVADMKANVPGAARAVLLKALDDFPGAPETAEIQYRIGETYFNEKDYKKASGAWDVVVKKFTKTEWASWALYRQGECFEALGKKDAAALFYQSVIDDYPKSPAAVDAKKKLAH